MAIRVQCEQCGQRIALDREGRFVLHKPADDMGRYCETSTQFPVSGYPEGSVWDISGGQWESNRRKH